MKLLIMRDPVSTPQLGHDYGSNLGGPGHYLVWEDGDREVLRREQNGKVFLLLLSMVGCV